MWVERVATQAACLADALQPAAVQGAGSSIVMGAVEGWLRNPNPNPNPNPSH